MNSIKNVQIVLLILFFSALSFSSFANSKPDAGKIFKQKCSFCHAIDKKKLGPAVNTMNKNAEVLRIVISKGKKPMPSFEGKLTSDEINALVDYLLANQ